MLIDVRKKELDNYHAEMLKLRVDISDPTSKHVSNDLDVGDEVESLGIVILLILYFNN